ncbi:sigma-54 interaction domain-containing protein [Thiohalobacter thiocyanaticus]|uniref:PAS domain-containing protein n=1 Tax=Thiohalobacter thiocyanaticus TaxID=585455 RepID=A0A426QL32_9GAMM|nr:sigma-54 dependent transcriptional regulator [Thiohalobacter thiocyanaticus]RRQ22396.1 PAS domain-containing protein [Thiohalobacter thiocyanaticus]
MFTLSTLSRFLDSLEEGVLFLDRGRRVVAINEAAGELLGRDRDEVLSRLCPSIFADTACARACEARGHCTLSESRTSTRQLQDISLARPDGLSVHLRMWSLLLPPNQADLYCAIILRDRSREVELEGEVRERLRLGGIVGHSPAMQALYEKILRAAVSEATVLVLGESGTGKELVARALHDNSSRSSGPYIAVHCAALPENLLEAELFGHARGAFTGAATARAGRFEAAHGGTLLLDEIGEIPPSIQVKLLRVLQEREIVRLGENHARPVDVRVLAATHRDLAGMVRRGEFREDLYYRLCVLPLEVPALRERREDIAMLATRLLEEAARNYKRKPPQLAHETVLQLERSDWPGNVRQLANAIEYALVHCDGGRILPHHLPPDIAHLAPEIPAPPHPPGTAPLTGYYRTPANDEDEWALIQQTLHETGGNKAEAARRLGMSRTTLWKRLRQNAPDKRLADN